MDGIETVVIRPGGSRWLGAATTAVIVLLMGAWFLSRGDIVFTLIGLLFIGMVVVFVPYVVWRMVRDDYSTTLRPSGLQVGVHSPIIPWSDIDSFGTFPNGATPYAR